jgi:hypothetical protein
MVGFIRTSMANVLSRYQSPTAVAVVLAWAQVPRFRLFAVRTTHVTISSAHTQVRYVKGTTAKLLYLVL